MEQRNFQGVRHNYQKGEKIVIVKTLSDEKTNLGELTRDPVRAVSKSTLSKIVNSCKVLKCKKESPNWHD